MIFRRNSTDESITGGEVKELGEELPREFLTELQEETRKLIIPRNNVIAPEQLQIILESMVLQLKLPSMWHAVAILTIFFQQGATAKSCDGNMSITVFEKTIKLAQIRKILKQSNCAKQERKLARSLATKIYSIAKIMKLEGNLTNKILRENPGLELSQADRIWLSDFQSDNPNCPVELRNYITNSFPKRRQKQSSERKNIGK